MPTPFRYLKKEEQLALAAEALRRSLTSFRSRQATLKAKKLLDEVIPAYTLTPLDYTQFVHALERLCGSVVEDGWGRRWLVLRLRKDSHNRTTVTLRRVDGVEAGEGVVQPW
jgi:hypothetical protein